MCSSLILKAVSEFPFHQNWIDGTCNELPIFSLNKVVFQKKLFGEMFALH